MRTVPLPQEILDELDFLNLEPLKTHTFAVQIEGEPFAVGFSEVPGLSSAGRTREIRELGYRGVHKFPDSDDHRAMRLVKGLDYGRTLWNWRQSVVTWDKDKPSYIRDVTITALEWLRDPVMYEVRSWILKRAWPSAWEGPAFNSMREDIAVESVELQHAGIVEQSGPIRGTVSDVLGALS